MHVVTPLCVVHCRGGVGVLVNVLLLVGFVVVAGFDGACVPLALADAGAVLGTLGKALTRLSSSSWRLFCKADDSPKLAVLRYDEGSVLIKSATITMKVPSAILSAPIA